MNCAKSTVQKSTLRRIEEHMTFRQKIFIEAN